MDKIGGCIDPNCSKCSAKLKQEKTAESQLQWLEEHGCTFANLLSDEDGEFILSEQDNGNPGEDGYNVDTQKIYLPNF